MAFSIRNNEVIAVKKVQCTGCSRVAEPSWSCYHQLVGAARREGRRPRDRLATASAVYLLLLLRFLCLFRCLTQISPFQPFSSSADLMFSSSSVFSHTSLRHSHLTRRCFKQSRIIPLGSLKSPLSPWLTISYFLSLPPTLHSVRRCLYRRHLAMYQHLRILLLSNLCPYTQGSTALLSNLLCTFLQASLMQQAPGDAALRAYQVGIRSPWNISLWRQAWGSPVTTDGMVRFLRPEKTSIGDGVLCPSGCSCPSLLS